MIITTEISMYPLRENYRDQISEFIDRLNTYTTLRVTTTPTSTMITGEYYTVMQMLTEMLEWSYTEHGRSVFVTKLIPGYDGE